MHAPAYALTGGHIFDAQRGEMIDGLAVEIANGQIIAVKPPDQLGEDVQRIDASGKSILPGLIDVHVHSEDWHAPLYLAKGITTVRDVGCALEPVLARRDQWNAAGAIAPQLLCTGPLLDGPGNQWWATTQLVQTPAEARDHVDRLVDAGVDQIKAYAFLSWECFEAIVDQAHKRGKRTLAHLGKHTDARRAIEAGLDELEHLSGIGEAMWPGENAASPEWQWMKLWVRIDIDRMARMIDLILERGTRIAITRLVWLRFATLWDRRHEDSAQMAYLPPSLRCFWNHFVDTGMSPALRRERSQQVAGMSIFTAELVRRGTSLMVGTDAPYPYLLPGFSYHDELYALLDCGMAEAQVLQAATLESARGLEIDQRVGSIEAGKQADLVIVNGNPLEDFRAMRRIDSVIRDGVPFDPRMLLDQAAAYAANEPERVSKRFNDLY